MQAMGAVVACAAIVTLLVGVFVTFQRPHLTRSTLHTPATPVVKGTPTGPGHPLVWTKITPPAGVVLDSLDTYIFQAGSLAHMLNTSVPHAWLSVAPSNGNVAYICQTRPDNTTHIWRTEDAGAHWTALPSISRAGAWPVCDVQIDENDPLTVVITLSDPAHYHYPGLVPALLTESGPAYVLRDGATQWQSTRSFIWAIASSHGSYYAIIGSANGPAYLYRSTDLQVWHTIDSSAWPTQGLGGVSGNPLPPAPQLWVQPETGAVLVILSNTFRGHDVDEQRFGRPLAGNRLSRTTGDAWFPYGAVAVRRTAAGKRAVPHLYPGCANGCACSVVHRRTALFLLLARRRAVMGTALCTVELAEGRRSGSRLLCGALRRDPCRRLGDGMGRGEREHDLPPECR